MGYQKFTADYLFTGNQLKESGYVLVLNENHFVEAIVPAAEAGGDVQEYRGILCPGFINAHCHLELSHMKGQISRETGMIDFLLEVMSQRFSEKEVVLEAIAQAEDHMLSEGIVAVGDICNTPDTINQKSLHRLYYHNFVEATGFLEATARDRFQVAKHTYDAFRQTALRGANDTTLVPHAPYSVSPTLFRMITEMPGNDLLSIHNQESLEEDDFFKLGSGDFRRLYEAMRFDISFYKATGKSSLQTILPYFYTPQRLLLVHNVMTREEDLQFIHAHGPDSSFQLPDLYWCLCPNANLYIGNGLPDVHLLRRYYATIVLGTDSLASNHQLSILAEVKTLQRHYPAIPMAELLQWATLNGARALNIHKQYGSFEAGKKPGVLLLEHDLTGVQRLV